MARKTKAEAEKTRQQLLDSAMKLFSEKGVAKTTLAQIAADAEMTRGAIYWHFEDKADLLHALFERSITPEAERLWHSMTEEGADPLKCLLQASHTFWLELNTESTLKQVMMLYRQAEQVPELAEKLDEMHCQEDSHMYQALKLASEQGALHPQMSVETAFTLFHTLHGGMVQLVCGARKCTVELDKEKIFRELIQGVERAVSAPERLT
ncbi:TetR family transcriptional regulator [Ferrimonas sp. YFM]|uniref:TetR family transcriptional regulator n=1 Tax=Ferrimonas sp. YFM TaxID=3028878 RepID=UPI00257220F3|nr:TetR family transcriptional regulator [Ferrimonas sp. YFM]BDY06203.1 TetR family transcriptional regulator [Ferrimonas sp. YFM]